MSTTLGRETLLDEFPVEFIPNIFHFWGESFTWTNDSALSFNCAGKPRSGVRATFAAILQTKTVACNADINANSDSAEASDLYGLSVRCGAVGAAAPVQADATSQQHALAAGSTNLKKARAGITRQQFLILACERGTRDSALAFLFLIL